MHLLLWASQNHLFNTEQQPPQKIRFNKDRMLKMNYGRLECGCIQLEVSDEHGITQSVTSRLWQRFQDDGNVSRCYNPGHPQVTTPNEDWYLAVTAKRNRRSTASDLSR
ncbi:HTH_Tnp_Tc3_2 domain-containing protein [Trichonephila clavipes]|nr:HTH_Tnp_Tc3_2 domain-containing protein [Trichonephila clavipes]